MARLSIIVPVFNVESFLDDCLESHCSQPEQGVEIICVNDGSTDRSGDICEEFTRNDSRCRVIHQRNQGQWLVRKAGQGVSSRQYLIFIDADDCFYFDMTSLLHDAILTDERFGFAMADMASVDQIPKHLSSQITTPPPYTLSPETLMLELCDRPRYPDRVFGFLWDNSRNPELSNGQYCDFFLRALFRTVQLWVACPNRKDRKTMLC